jgi:hypothetical protein
VFNHPILLRVSDERFVDLNRRSAGSDEVGEGAREGGFLGTCPVLSQPHSGAVGDRFSGAQSEPVKKFAKPLTGVRGCVTLPNVLQDVTEPRA